MTSQLTKKKKYHLKGFFFFWPENLTFRIKGHDRISKTISGKDLCDHDNYFWRETNCNINLIVPNLGCRKR